MSLKYQRVKQTDLLLPAPLRWTTRAFSSITLAVILLVLVALYGTLASVPVTFLLKGLFYGLLGLGGVGAGMLAGYHVGIGQWWPGRGRARIVRGTMGWLLVAIGAAATVGACGQVNLWISQHPWFTLHRATVLYRLPGLEMTELEFYSWWPLKLILGLFVLNMVWATIRRIEFKFQNIGVLSVHSGIVLIALGSMIYGHLKLEGDTILFRQDLGGGPVRAFYDQKTPALFVYWGGSELMVPLPSLPRYNDHLPPILQGEPLPAAAGDQGPLDIRLDDNSAFENIFAGRVRAAVTGFVAYGDMTTAWVEGPSQADDAEANPALTVAIGDINEPSADPVAWQTLLAHTPGQRYFQMQGLSVEYLRQPTEARLAELRAELPANHALIVEVPASGFRGIYGIEPGQTIDVGQTGYQLTVENVGPYGMPFVTPGYEGATDTQATMQVTQGPRTFRRIVMSRFPERSQDFVLAPGDPNVGPMGKRVDPDPAIKLTYIDASEARFYVIDSGKAGEPLRLMVRLPSSPETVIEGMIPEGKFPLGKVAGHERWLHVVSRLHDAQPVEMPVPTPKAMRQPRDEGTFVPSLLAVDLQFTGRDGKSTTRRLWLRHMRYPMLPEGDRRARVVDVPGVGPIGLAFSRVRRSLPLAIKLDRFEMQPYPGSQIPRDFVASLEIQHVDAQGQLTGQIEHGEARLNNPLIARGLTWQEAKAWAGGNPIAAGMHYLQMGKLKISQIAWDPGDPGDPRKDEKDDQGQFTRQQRYTILGVGNNAAIQVIFVGAVLVAVGIPWAFYIKPLLARQQKKRIQAQLACEGRLPAREPVTAGQT
ncbi:MAG: hypothetical protein IT441_10375 [Phycisphaeraceae bacterium]|nr:hypothetical protein [Phycisphaeraceae bacterium]